VNRNPKAIAFNVAGKAVEVDFDLSFSDCRPLTTDYQPFDAGNPKPCLAVYFHTAKARKNCYFVAVKLQNEKSDTTYSVTISL